MTVCCKLLCWFTCVVDFTDCLLVFDFAGWIVVFLVLCDTRLDILCGCCLLAVAVTPKVWFIIAFAFCRFGVKVLFSCLL